MAKRITDKEKKEMIAYYIECQSYREVGRKFKRDDKTVKKIVENDKDLLKKSAQKKEKNNQSVLDSFENLAKVKKDILNSSLYTIACRIKEGSVSTSELIRIYGIIVDKELAFRDLKLREKETSNEQIQRIQIINEFSEEDK